MQREHKDLLVQQVLQVAKDQQVRQVLLVHKVLQDLLVQQDLQVPQVPLVRQDLLVQLVLQDRLVLQVQLVQVLRRCQTS